MPLENFKKLEITEEHDENKELFRLILSAYKKLKDIAKQESKISEPLTPSPARLSSDDINEISYLENKIGCTLIAYEKNTDLLNEKSLILKNVIILLNDYLSLSSSRKKKNINFNLDNFNGFFE